MALDSVTEAWLVQTVEELVKERTDLKDRLLEAERKLAENQGRSSSVQVGSDTKGGPGIGKCYFDPLAPAEINNAAIFEARRIWAAMGGSPLPPQPFDETAERQRLGLPIVKKEAPVEAPAADQGASS